tara:strand:- start:2062 stop:2655 length:594 start_codon:yes stop_codon:yes gene_type:complete
MKKLLLTLFIIPAFIYGQDTPLIEQKVTTEKMEKEDQKKKDKDYKKSKRRTITSFDMHPKNQIGYIMSLPTCPLGLNYYNFFNKHIGMYIDYKYGDQVYVGTTSIVNGGIAFPVIKNARRVFILYLGFGAGTQTTEYLATNDYSTDNYLIYDDQQISYTYGNFNFGILRQTNALISWQLGFDTAVPGINLGMGFTWK